MNESRATVSAKEAMKRIGVSRATISRMVLDRELEAYKLTLARNSPYRIYVDSLESFLKRRQQPTK